MRQRFLARLGRFYRQNNAKWLIILFVGLVLLPSCLMVYGYYLKSSDIIEKEVTDSILQTLKETEINVENTLDYAESISESVFVNKEVMDFVGDENNTDIPLQALETDDLRTLFASEIRSNGALKIRMFVSNAKIAASESVNFFPVSDVAGKDWYPKVVSRKGGLYWTGVYSQDYIESGSENIISCARVLKHTFNYNDNNGILLVDVKESAVYAILSGISLRKGERLYLVDEDGVVISCQDKSQLGKPAADRQEVAFLQSGGSGVTNLTKNGRKVTVIYQTISNTRWKLMDEVDRDEIVRTNLVFNNIYIFVIIITTFIFFAFGIFLMVVQIMNRLNRKIQKLESDIEKEGVDILDDSAGMRTNGDSIKLETYIYGMIRKVKDLMEETYQSKIREREAQLAALQAQINPHFLYNTLDTINWMAVRIHAQDISVMIDSLAKYFRLSLSKGKTVVSIGDELELVRVYLTIQNVRFQGAIQFQIHVEEGVEKESILKLTIQPIVENAVLHGIQKKTGRSGSIRVDAVRRGDDICLSVTDDGVGMSPEICENILSNAPQKKEGHYGLYNVNERLRLYYGKEYGITLHSEPQRGTRVDVRIKVAGNSARLSV